MKKSKKAKGGAPARKKKGIKKATAVKTAKAKNRAPKPVPLAPSPLPGSFGGKTEDQ